MKPTQLESDAAALWITLHQIQGLGNVSLYQLLAKFGTPDHIFNASISQLKEVVSETIASKIHQGIDEQTIQPSLDWLAKDNTHIVTLADEEYPQQLFEISNPPVVLYAIGNLKLMKQPSIAMVGSRNATPQGEKMQKILRKICVKMAFALSAAWL